MPNNQSKYSTMVVTLLTDFGLEDSYVAEVKAVLLSCGRKIEIIDITHEIPPFDVEWGAFQLMRAYNFFSPGTLHFAIVDPGVGSDRRCLHVQTKTCHFVGPDNGVLLWAVRDCERRENQRATISEIPLKKGLSSTFHARDLMAPYVVQLLKGKKDRIKRKAELKGREFPAVRELDGRKFGEIIGFDHFGNAITSIPVRPYPIVEAHIGHRVERLTTVSNYQSIIEGEVALVPGSHGFWEVAAKEDSAVDLLDLKKGEPVTVFPLP